MAGVFGKLPGAGDFVARGLPPGAAQVLDAWLTRRLVLAAAEPGAWPEGGIRAVIDTPSGPVVAVVLPSADRIGRPFPLAAAAAAVNAGLAEAEAWADAAAAPLAAAARGELSPDALAAALAEVPPPQAGEVPLLAPVAWAAGETPAPPSEALPRLLEGLSSARSCYPSS